MKIQLEMTDGQFEELQMDLADIVWCLEPNPELQKRAIQIANLLDVEVPRE